MFLIQDPLSIFFKISFSTKSVVISVTYCNLNKSPIQSFWRVNSFHSGLLVGFSTPCDPVSQTLVIYKTEYFNLKYNQRLSHVITLESVHSQSHGMCLNAQTKALKSLKAP